MQRRLLDCLNIGIGLFLCLLLLALVFSLPAVAADERFTVRDVPVDATAGSAEEAKNKAFNDGQRQAFQQLVQTVSGSDNTPKLSDNDLLRLVQGVEVADEKISATRYRAKLTVSFRESRTKAFLQQSHIALHAEEATPGSDSARPPSTNTGSNSGEAAAPVANAAPVKLVLDISNFTDWLRAKQQLQRINGFANLRLTKLSQAQAEFAANWNAGTGSLAEQLANNRFEVVGEGSSNSLRLRYRP